MIISPINISPLSPKRSGVGATPLISTMYHEWYFQNVLNASGNIITIPDTGSVGGLDLSNPALANKPTASTIGTKISYAADGIDDYLYKSETNFMKSMPTWMVTIVFKYDSSSNNRFLTSYNETNVNAEGWQMIYNTTAGAFQMFSSDSLGSVTTSVTVTQALVNGTNQIITFAYTGSDVKVYSQTTQIATNTTSNPALIPTQTDNVATMALIKPVNGNVFGKGNIGYIGVDEFDLTRLNNNVTTLKSTFGI